MIKLLRKNKRGGDGINNFRLITMLNTELMILANDLANRLQVVVPSLISPEQTCAEKGRTFQDNLHLASLIVEQVESGAALINFDLIGLIDFLGLFSSWPASGRTFGPGSISCVDPPVRWWK